MTQATRKTVKVRIAVAVDERGNWSGFGWPTVLEHEMLTDALNSDDLGGVRHALIIEADVPLPLPPKTIKGKVTAAKKPKSKRSAKR